MGLLDDAIREHLELKRQHGAAPDEVARQEHEALGPVRREPAFGAEAADVVGDEHDDDLLDAPTELSPLPAYAEDDDAADEDRDGPVAVRGPGGSVPASDAALGETQEWGFEEDEEEEDEDPAGEGDVLEQTPEFLSDTPEHDRLWFEQKPPRDFDFDP